ncbi:hypothetical protein S245_071545, partial [Arachis hypogaea]
AEESPLVCDEHGTVGSQESVPERVPVLWDPAMALIEGGASVAEAAKDRIVIQDVLLNDMNVEYLNFKKGLDVADSVSSTKKAGDEDSKGLEEICEVESERTVTQLCGTGGGGFMEGHAKYNNMGQHGINHVGYPNYPHERKRNIVGVKLGCEGSGPAEFCVGNRLRGVGEWRVESGLVFGLGQGQNSGALESRGGSGPHLIGLEEVNLCGVGRRLGIPVEEVEGTDRGSTAEGRPVVVGDRESEMALVAGSHGVEETHGGELDRLLGGRLGIPVEEVDGTDRGSTAEGRPVVAGDREDELVLVAGSYGVEETDGDELDRLLVGGGNDRVSLASQEEMFAVGEREAINPGRRYCRLLRRSSCQLQGRRQHQQRQDIIRPKMNIEIVLYSEVFNGWRRICLKEEEHVNGCTYLFSGLDGNAEEDGELDFIENLDGYAEGTF